MSNSYQDGLARLLPTEAKTLASTLAGWAKTLQGRVVVPNIQLEHFLPATNMACLLRVLVANATEPPLVLSNLYQVECYRHIRKGGSVKVNPRPKLLGRCVDAPTFVNWLVRFHGKFFVTVDQAKDFVRRLITGDPLTTSERRLIMSEFSAWVTWNPTDPQAGDPFSFVRFDLADEVGACLGLPPQRRGNPVLLLVYQRAPRRRLRRPTVADANLHEYFQPPPLEIEDSGWTKPWPSTFLRGKLRGVTPEPRPEAVHRPEVFGQLRRVRKL